jgi:hypothetical protein
LQVGDVEDVAIPQTKVEAASRRFAFTFSSKRRDAPFTSFSTLKRRDAASTFNVP